MNTAFKNPLSSGDFAQTPPDLWEEIRNAFFGKKDVLDPCPGLNPLDGCWGICDQDSLLNPWTDLDNLFINPPFSNIEPWISRMETKEVQQKFLYLLPVRTDQPWWHKYAMQGTIYFIQGRVWYVNPETGLQMKQPNFASCLVAFGNPKKLPSMKSWWPICHQKRRKVIDVCGY